MKVSNRKARQERELQLNSLEAFANLGEETGDWKRFQLKFPHFFPQGLSNWFYEMADDWAKIRAEVPESLEPSKPSLLWYRDRLRAVWTNNDPNGINLSILLGFEEEAREAARTQFPADPSIPAPVILPLLIRGKSLAQSQETIGGLPRGKPRVNGLTGAIEWEFGCELQQAVYELMPNRWRARVCPECGKYFIADKTAQTYCSLQCYGEMKRKRSLDYWRREGNKKREQRLKGKIRPKPKKKK
ncbi:MAG TPA: hypothetical protein VK699_19875 [Terriglobales bacterium]|jgi:hypothetical protein|nr:hypothetical protein [Terriglobales bacterium]